MTEQNHCNHECVCAVLAMTKESDTPCDFSGCKFDTRLSPPTHSSQALLLMAENDWHNREERKGIHDRTSWISGWITGYLTPGKPEWRKK